MVFRFLVPYATLATISLSVPAAAQSPFFEDGMCALIVASRPNVAEARSYIYEHGWANHAGVFLSENGWYAIGVDLVSLDHAKGILDARKASGIYPPDAYCSTGRKYVRSVAWDQNSGSSTTPVSTGLWEEFDARPMTTAEKRFLQAALAMSGHYNGLLDGVWGNGSQRSLERYTFEEFDTNKPANAHAVALMAKTMGTWIDDGWRPIHIGWLDLSMMLPMDKLELVKEDGTEETWDHTEKDLRIVLDDLQWAERENVHRGIANAEDRTSQPYTLRGSDTWVTSVSVPTGSMYVRSDLIAGTWSTIAIFAGHGLDAEVGLISSSIKKGSPDDILPTEGGALRAYARDLDAFMAERREEQPPVASTEPAPGTGFARSEPPTSGRNEDSGTDGSTGTAFYVTDNGVALTNAHVVDSCSSVSLGGMPAEIVTVSQTFDLAAVRLMASEPTTPLAFAEGDAALNSDITFAGYPLHGLLGGLNVSRGSVSSMKGLQGDETSIQISAPVQPGNSGGPAIDRFGGVVGVVVAKLDTMALADATGDIAQNVNFAIRGSLAKVFMSSNGIDYQETGEDSAVAPEKAAELLQTSTTLVECE